MLDDRKYVDAAEYRENVSYAIGEPLGEFSYIPHWVFPDGAVYLSPESVRMLWEWHHADWFKDRFEEKHHGT